MERVSAEIAQRLQETQTAIELLDTVRGISQRAAEILLAKLGSDLSRFPSAKHLVSLAEMCPANKESGAWRRRGWNFDIRYPLPNLDI
jgi:transposase